ncbi:MAG: hypothetical protein R3A47_12590 [Polyangiales bacterium]
MFRKFVFITGALDVLIGIGPMVGAISAPAQGTFVSLMTLGAFLMFAGAVLMWATRKLPERAPVVFWQGLVRLTAVFSILYAVPNRLSYTWEYGVAAFDGVVALTYVIGSMRVTGASFFALLFGRYEPTA